MWIIDDIWSNKDYPCIADYNLALECSICGKKISIENAVGKLIQKCECETTKVKGDGK
jgi:hypothetical protein